MRKNISITLITCFAVVMSSAQSDDYLHYHRETIRAEKMIINGSYQQALETYQALIEQFPFVFLRDQKIATQLAWKLGKEHAAFDILQQAITNGWKKKSIKRNSFLKPMRQHPRWELLMVHYDSMTSIYENRLDHQLRAEVRSMSLRDQRKAMGALLKFGSKAQDKYGEEKFARHNEKHLLRLIEIIQQQGYPGEKLIGYDPWAQGIFSRHNSISQAYCKKDTLYAYTKPLLKQALIKGEMNPADHAYIQDWFISVKSGWSTSFYGSIGQLKKEELTEANSRRQEIGLRPVHLRNQLIDLQENLGMNFYLPMFPGKNVKINVAL
ncbi:MAG: hypothetical protein OER04_13700 [Cyclobacteriaceae bacterium]|nr:hypothetical protein [Cyclobacteriaceae bacterium]